MFEKRVLVWVLGVLMFLHFTAGVSFRNLPAPGQYAARKLSADDNSGFISIDCGATVEYTDGENGVFYHTDERFIDTGTNHQVPASVVTSRVQLRTLRSFPEGTKNCYTLKPKQGKDNIYMIRATFIYGNYDGKSLTPTFDLNIGVSRWLTITLSATDEEWCEITYVPSTDYISFCLVNTNRGVPVISFLELCHLPNNIYPVGINAMETYKRFDTGSRTSTLLRYKGDAYDRIWQSQMIPSNSLKKWLSLSTTSTIDVADSENLYKPPPEVLQTAATTNNASVPLNYYQTPSGFYIFYAYFHFTEIEELQGGKKRELVIYSNNDSLQEPFTLDFLKPRTIGPILLPYVGSQLHFSIGTTNGSGLPPILNGFEIFRVFELQGTPTNSGDIDAIMDVKMTYRVTKNWQGDPCVDTPWSGLNCSSSSSSINYPRIISLNLSSSGLTGDIATSIFSLTSLQILDLSHNSLSGFFLETLLAIADMTSLEVIDLSHNNLTGPLPAILAEMPSLKVIDLSGNNFNGYVRVSLQDKSANGALSLRLDGNPDLWLEPRPKRKSNLPLIAVSLVVVLALAALAALAIWWKWKRSYISKENEDPLKSKKHEFTFSDILAMTHKLKTVIGTGGFVIRVDIK